MNTEKPILVFQTDFTYKEGAVSSMYGVVKCVDRELEIFDSTHEIPQYDMWSASYRLMQVMKFWPKGTIFVSVVDPGVGTKRRACVALTNDGYYVVTPDNGTLTHIMATVGIKEVREIDESINRLKGKDNEKVAIFHGRDLFGYCAARLASGIITYEQVGPKYDVKDIVCLPIVEPKVINGGIEGIFEINDPNFGNVWTNVECTLFDEAGFNYGDILHTVVEHEGKIVLDKDILYHQSFGMVNKGELIIYRNEMNKASIAVSQGSAIELYHLGYGSDWKVTFHK